MRRGELFWGGLLILLGALLLLKATGYLAGDVFSWFWPLFIMVLGIWLLAGGFGRRSRHVKTDKISILVLDAQRATLAVEHGAGELQLRSGADPGDFLTGISAVGMQHSEWRDGDRLLVRLESGPSFIPVLGSEGGIWEFRLNRDIPIDLSFHSGASLLKLDLSDLLVTSLSFDGGATRLEVNLPARVQNSMVNLRAGAAHLEIIVPPGVALRLRTRTIGHLDIDESRFPHLEQDLYQSIDFDSAQHRADLTLDGGATTVRIQ